MNHQTETIRKFVNYLNNESHLGGFWLPHIQREFVWKEDQIERLYDSILREYPIGSLLIWKTKSEIKHRKFIDAWREEIKLSDFFRPIGNQVKMLVLDGQQRLQSLYIGLKGTYEKKQLYFNILSGDLKNPDDKKYEFKFHSQPPGFPFVLFSSLVFPDKRNKELKQEINTSYGENFTDAQDDRIDVNIELIRKVFCTDENIAYQIVDSIDRPDTYTDEDIVEIFIRANSGGTKLDKSELLFSLLVSSWDDAYDNMENLLTTVNAAGFEFSRDFILKTCLVLLNKGAQYKVSKFREQDIKQLIESNWSDIEDSIKDVHDNIIGKTFIQSDKVLTSYLALIPIIYFRYHFPEKWNSVSRVNEYYIRTMLSAVFSGNPDYLIDKLIRRINKDGDFIIENIFDEIRNDGRILDITQKSLLSISYTDKKVHLLFNLWYDFNYKPAYQNNQPQVDHIFPQSHLKSIKEANSNAKRKKLKYNKAHRDQVANLMLLTKEENGAGQKGHTMPKDWFKNKTPEYLNLHLIPQDPQLWEEENYEQFLEERKKMIIKKFQYLLTDKSIEA